MKPNLESVLTPTIISLVKSCLLARAYAELMREQVDRIGVEILALPEFNLQATLCRRAEPHRITVPKDLYLCEDEAACKRYYAEANRREREAKLKPEEMPDEHCPALCAETLQRDAEHALCDEVAPLFGLTTDRLTMHLDNYRQFLDLVFKIVVNHPKFKQSPHFADRFMKPQLQTA